MADAIKGRSDMECQNVNKLLLARNVSKTCAASSLSSLQCWGSKLLQNRPALSYMGFAVCCLCPLLLHMLTLFAAPGYVLNQGIKWSL